MISTAQNPTIINQNVLSNLQPKLLEAAQDIGYQLCKEAIWHQSLCTWIGLEHDFQSGKNPELISATIGPGIYNGTAGIAQFLMTLDKILDQPLLKTHVGGAIRHALYKGKTLPKVLQHSYWSGMFGIAVVTIEVGEYYCNDNLRIEGISILKNIFTSDVENGSGMDVLDGSAGAILASLKFMDLIPGDIKPLLTKYIITHIELIMNASRVNEIGRSWPSVHNDKALLGYAHGNAGYAHALIEAGHFLENSRYIDAGKEAIQYENHFYNKEHNNWPDFRKHPGQSSGLKFMNAWCHGAMGIGLSRLRCFELENNLSYLADAKRCLLHSCIPQGIDNTSSCQCHGFSGNAELLIYANQLLGEKTYVQSLESLARESLIYHNSGKSWINGLNTDYQVPGLMDGLAGVGNYFLRMYDPKKVPSILI